MKPVNWTPPLSLPTREVPADMAHVGWWEGFEYVPDSRTPQKTTTGEVE